MSLNEKFTTSQAGYCTQQSTFIHTALPISGLFFSAFGQQENSGEKLI